MTGWGVADARGVGWPGVGHASRNWGDIDRIDGIIMGCRRVGHGVGYLAGFEIGILRRHGPIVEGVGSLSGRAPWCQGASSLDDVWDSEAVNAYAGELWIVGTPIGNVDDASPAAREALIQADVIAAEDTRRLQTLLRRAELASTARVVSNFEGNEAVRAQELIEHLELGRNVALVSDAGMPLVSDPGYRAVQAAIAAGIRIRVIPGPSAVLVALGLSGLPTDRFCFEGFLPRKTGARARRLAEVADDPRTMVFFEAPHRLHDFLGDAVSALGPERPAAVCRELTKTFEEVRRGSLAELLEWAEGEIRGEVTVVVGGAPDRRDAPVDAVDMVVARVAAGERFSTVVAEVAAALGVPRKALYSRALAARQASEAHDPGREIGRPNGSP